jgi:SAM-dependent methyltransferase
MYRVGFTPWDNEEVPAELSALVEGSGALTPGAALDVGCGTGTQAVFLAAHGWRVTAIDAVDAPLRRARARAGAQGVSVSFRRGDASRLTDLRLERDFELIFDRGCFHDLSSRQRAAYAVGVTELAAPDATLLMMAFAPNHVPVGPSGAAEREITTLFDGWELTSNEPDSGPPPPGPMRGVPRRWYRLRRRSGEPSAQPQ